LLEENSDNTGKTLLKSHGSDMAEENGGASIAK
jgi:hypothetical protein